MSHENKSKDHGALRFFEIQLTRPQWLSFLPLLPPGYTITLASNFKKKTPSSNPSKKLFTNEGNAIKFQAKSKPMPREEVYQPKIKYPSELTPTSVYTDNGDQSTKRILREQNKKKPKNYSEDIVYPEILPVPTTSSKPVTSAISMAEATKKCMNLLQRLKKHNCAYPFLYPVDVEGLGLYDYYDVVTEPMDLSTVEKKLKNGEYSSVNDFGNDIRKIWNNAFSYNTEGSPIYVTTEKISSYFERIFKEIEDVQFSDKVTELEKKVKMLSQQLASLNKPEPVLAKKVSTFSNKPFPKSPSIMEEPMSTNEKKILCDNIRRLSPEALRGVWEIVSRGLPASQGNQEELVFDIDALPVKITRELERYVNAKLGITANKNKSKSKPKEAAKPPVVSNTAAYDNNMDYYHHTQPVNPAYQSHMPSHHPPKADDALSKSSESSFISDSESGSDDERKHKRKHVT